MRICRVTTFCNGNVTSGGDVADQRDGPTFANAIYGGSHSVVDSDGFHCDVYALSFCQIGNFEAKSAPVGEQNSSRTETSGEFEPSSVDIGDINTRASGNAKRLHGQQADHSSAENQRAFVRLLPGKVKLRAVPQTQLQASLREDTPELSGKR